MNAALDPEDARVTALVAAADDDVSCDGLRVRHEASGYSFETPDTTWTDLSEDGLRQVAADRPRYVTNWYLWTHIAPGGAERAYLRWVDHADGLDVPERYDRLERGLHREWGQLRITARLTADGSRRYDIRHRSDRELVMDALERHEDPYDVRDLVRVDEQGRYRPLKTAPTLRRGWVLADLTPAELTRAVGLIYPATIHNWHRERTGQLDVTHWRSAADRQTGMYAVVADLPDQAVSWLAAACCVDEACLKRREWDLDEETPIDVSRGNGAFPCREPCSLAIAVAREVALDEEAVAGELTVDDPTGPIDDDRRRDVREGAVANPANPYRVRYRRAKHGIDPRGPGDRNRTSTIEPDSGEPDADPRRDPETDG